MQHARSTVNESWGACPDMFGGVSQSGLRDETDLSRRAEELEQQQPPVSKAAEHQTGKFSLFLPNEP